MFVFQLNFPQQEKVDFVLIARYSIIGNLAYSFYH